MIYFFDTNVFKSAYYVHQLELENELLVVNSTFTNMKFMLECKPANFQLHVPKKTWDNYL